MSNTFTEGEAFAPQRSLFNALGFTKEEMRKPLVGIVSSYNEIVPGHMNIDKIVDAVKLGVAMAGGTSLYSQRSQYVMDCHGTCWNENIHW